jgi:hypothetical protein
VKFRIVIMFVTTNLQNIIRVLLATGPAPADQVRRNSDNEDNANPKFLPLLTVQHPRRSESSGIQNLSHQFQHLQHILQSICPTIKIIYAFLVPSHHVYFYIILNVFSVEIRGVKMTKFPAKQLASSEYMRFQT